MGARIDPPTLFIVSAVLLAFLAMLRRRFQLFICVFLYVVIVEALLHIPVASLHSIWQALHFPSNSVLKYFAISESFVYSDIIGWFADLFLISLVITLIIETVRAGKKTDVKPNSNHT